MIIGSFISASNGFSGRLQSLCLDAELSLVPALESATENAPDWRVLMGDSETGFEVGAGWNRTGQRAGDYIALQIDDPSLPRPLRANLLRTGQDNVFQLLWSRPAQRAKP